MSDRTVKVSLTAQVSGYIAGMEKAAAATRKTSSEATKLAQKKEAFTQVGHALLAIGTVAAVGVGLAVKAFADFDAKMSQVKTLSHATAGEMAQLSEAALNMGQKIGFSATQVADAEIELVKAGISVKDIMGGALKGSLELAAAGQIDVAQATEIATIALTQFGLKGKDVPHVADLLAAGADKALGGVADLGEALKSGGLVASQFGISLDETIGTLSAFANAGLIGEVAGTDLRQMLLKLADPSAQAAADMKKLGITLYDQTGKFVGVSNLAGQLKDKLGGLSEAQRNQTLSTIFGARAIAGANVLYKEGAKGISDWTNKVNDTGFAAQQARGKMDNLQGDIKKLSAAFETDLIRAGSSANGALRGVVKTITNLVSAFASLPGPVQGGVLAVGAVVAVVGLLGGGVLTVVPKIAAFKVALGELSTSMRTVSIAGGAVALVITGIVTVLSLMAGAQADAKQTAQDLADTLDQETGAITKNTRAYAADKLQKDGTIKASMALGLTAREVVDAYLQQPKALAKATQALKDMKDPTSDLGKKARASGESLAKMSDGVLYLRKALEDGSGATKEAKERLKELRAAADDGSGATDGATKSVDALAAATDKAATSADDFNKALADLGKVNLDASSATIKYQQSLADANAAIAKNGATLDIATQAGRDNRSSLDDIASSAVSVIASQQAAGASTASLTSTMATARAGFVETAIKMGATAAQANNLADQYGLIPDNVSTAFHATGADAAIAEAQRLKAAYDAINRLITIHVDTIIQRSTLPDLNGNVSGSGRGGTSANGNLFVGGVAKAFANGGMSPGVYSGGSPLYKFAEPETRWEAFISGKPGQEERNRMVWRDAGQRLGTLGSSSGKSDRPIMMDGSLFGILREMANGEAQIVLNSADQAKARKFKQG